MKKGRIIAVLLALICLWLPILTESAVFGAQAGVKISGNETIRAGETLTVTISISGDELVAFLGTITYDAGKLEFLEEESLISGWGSDTNANAGKINLILMNENLDAPISGTDKRALRLRFRVKSSLSTGTSVKVELSEVTLTSMEEEFTLSGASYKNTVSRPLSSNANLSALTMEGAVLSPEFDPSVTEYDAGVIPFSIADAVIGYEREQEGAKVTIEGGENLIVGENVVWVHVEAEDGTKKVYRITFEREQDPNYVPSSDASLVDITLSTGTLSPEFLPETVEYLVTVAFEITQITAQGIPGHELAQGCEAVTIDLTVGVNTLTLVNRAEDGSEARYIVHVIRMPLYTGHLPEVTPGTEPPPETDPPVTEPPQTDPPATEPPETTPPETSSAPTEEPTTDAPETQKEPKPSPLADTTVLLMLSLSGAVMLGLGLIIGALMAKPKKKHYRTK